MYNIIEVRKDRYNKNFGYKIAERKNYTDARDFALMRSQATGNRCIVSRKEEKNEK